MFIDFSDDNILEINPINESDTMKFNFINQLNLEDEVKLRLSNHLTNLIKGYDTSIITPIGKDKNLDDILKRWDNIYNKSDKIIKELDSLEKLNRDKFGSRSIAKPWSQRKENTLSYFGEGKIIDTNQFKEFFPKASLRPLNLDNAIKYLKSSTNSGLPFYTKKSNVKDILRDNFEKLLDREDPCILFTRTQEGNKTRDVWGYPIADTTQEMKYYRPLLNYQKELDFRSALLGPTHVDSKITDMINYAIKHNFSLVSMDFKGYDTSLKRSLQEASFHYIKSLFQTRYHSEIDRIKYRFNTIGIVTPSGITSGYHGVPSGSTFTNEVDSIAQYLILKKFNKCDKYQIQGDDGAYVIRNNKDYIELLSLFKDMGLNVNEEKSYLSNNYIIYLQCLHHKHYEKDGLISGIYPTYRALNRIIFQERWTNFEEFDIEGEDYYSIRTLSILENCKHHPLFRELVQFVKSLDKYGLKFSQKSIDKYNRYLINSKGSGGIINNQYGDDIRGIRNFESYKIANNIA